MKKPSLRIKKLVNSFTDFRVTRNQLHITPSMIIMWAEFNHGEELTRDEAITLLAYSNKQVRVESTQ